MKTKKKLSDSERNFMENAIVDSSRLRVALLMACTELTGGDPMAAMELSEQFYDEAPNVLKALSESGLDNLPGGPAKLLDFPQKRH